MRKAFSGDKWKYMLYTMTHPVDGFYWLRHQDERASLPLALLLVVLFSLSFSAHRLLSAFIVNTVEPKDVNSWYELIGVAAFFLLLCVSNWSITCLMGGEGRLKDIAVAIGYGTFPITLTLIISTFLSQFVADNEQGIYKLFIGVGIAYGAFIMIVGIMQVHNYTFGKTLITLLLTFIAMLIIVFLLLLLSNLIGLVINFFKSIYLEIIFR